MFDKLATRVLVASIIFIGLLAISAVVDVVNARATSSLIGHLNDIVAPRLLESSEFDTHVTRAIRELQTFALGGEEDELDEARVALDAAWDDLAALDAMHSHDDDLNPLEASYHNLNERRRELLGLLENTMGGPGLSSDAMLFDVIEEIEREIEALSAESRIILDDERALATSLAAQRIDQNSLVIAIGIGLPILFSLGALLYLHRAIVRPIRDLAAAKQAFARGDLRRPVAVDGPAEIRVLQSSFNTLVDTIGQQTRELIAQATVAEEIRAQARAAQALADELAQRNAQIAAQAEALQAEISERQMAEASLIQARDAAQAASRAKSTFLATMSHELRTPLTAILGYSQMLSLMAASGDYSRVGGDLVYINTAGQHLLSLINDLLDLSRIEAGKLPVTFADVQVLELVREVTMTTRPLAERARNTFVVNCPPDIGLIESDEMRVRQTLLNLLSNATKFTEGGTITLTVEAVSAGDHELLRFRVADTGIGIRPEQLARLFLAFSQVDDSSTRRYGGAGLGLALSKQLAHVLGGDVRVESTFGVGSVFTLELPRTQAGRMASTPDAVSPLTALGAGAVNYPAFDADKNDSSVFDLLALCIDDDLAVAGLLKHQLRDANIAVVQASTGDVGLERARDLLPDLIFLDLLMPGLDGWGVLEQLKADPDLAGIPVIMLSVDDQQRFDLVVDLAGYLRKPLDPRRVVAVVQAALSHHDIYAREQVRA
jgi:signal transduction histidine kinase/ActR/RegA family two-component response regulator